MPAQIVMPAKAGIQEPSGRRVRSWTPACAGATKCAGATNRGLFRH